MSGNTSTWPDGTPRSQGNAFDWRTWDLDEETRQALQRASDASKGAAVTTEPRQMNYYQRAVAK